MDSINPEHYRTSYPFEVIDLIRLMLSDSEFVGFCLGNEIKYRMRAGIKNKETALEDIGKAEWYRNARKTAETK